MVDAFNYPFHLSSIDIYTLLPHRGEMQLIKQLTVFANDHFKGIAEWSEDSAVLQGHFPGMPIVPGVLLVEAVAQVAGAGMLAGDAYAQSIGQGSLGLLAGIRKCSFKRPVLPGEQVCIEVHTRQMSDTAATISGRVTVNGDEAGQIELFVINSSRTAIENTLAEIRSSVVAAQTSP